MFWINFEKLCAEIGKSPNAVATELGIPSGSITAWSKGTKPRNQTVRKIADYFDVTVQSLLGEQQLEHSETTVGSINYDRMNALIKKSGKTKLFLCGQLGKGKTYLRDAEKQKTNISGETLRILAAELNTTPEYLTGETDDPEIKKSPTPTRSVEDFAKVYELLTPENQAKMKELVIELLKEQLQH